jgi:hypothetical protein
MAKISLGRVSGYSAYELWLLQGHVGSEAVFLDSLKSTAPGPGVATGGLAGQLLKKTSGVDYDTAWTDVEVEEAPVSGSGYVRKDGGWVLEAPFPEAPNNSKAYVRKNQNWAELVGMLPSGGTAGQVLKKSSSADYAVAFATPSYEDLSDKPAIDGTVLDEDSTAAGLGLATVTGLNTKLTRKRIFSDTSWEMYAEEAEGGGHWYWDYATGMLRFEGFNTDSESPVVWERYEVSGGGPNFVVTGGTRVGTRLMSAWSGGSPGEGDLRVYYTQGRDDDTFTADDEITTRQWVRTYHAEESGMPRGSVATHADLEDVVSPKLGDWVYVEDDTQDTLHVGETWCYAFDGDDWVALVRINEFQISDDNTTITVADGVRKVKSGGISSTELGADSVIDAKIGERTLLDNVKSGTLVAVAAKNLTQWLQGIRDNLKALFADKLDIQQDAGDEGKALIIGSDGKLTPGVSGKVDSVDGVEPTEGTKDVRLTYTYETEAEYEADKDNIPEGARVVLLDKYPNNHLMVERPDYAKMESTNRISVNDGTWTADRLGFVYLYGAISIASGSTGYVPHVLFYINGKQVAHNVKGSQDNINVSIGSSGVFPVKPGDIVKIYLQDDTSSGITLSVTTLCYFIPPIYEAQLQPKIVAGIDSDYSLTEQPVMKWDPFTATVSQRKWLDGKQIYTRTFVATADNPPSGTDLTVVAGSLQNCMLIDSKTLIAAANGSNRIEDVPGSIPEANPGGYAGVRVHTYQAPGGDINVWIKYSLTNADLYPLKFYVTVQYTKI